MDGGGTPNLSGTGDGVLKVVLVSRGRAPDATAAYLIAEEATGV